MTRVEFFFNVEDKLQKLAELSEKAVTKNIAVTILTHDEAMTASVQQYLWQQPTSFLPNARLADAKDNHSQIVVDWQMDAPVHDDVLINLQPSQPTIFSRFKRLIEIVSLDEDDKVLARARYKFYRDRGYEIRSYDVLEKAI